MSVRRRWNRQVVTFTKREFGLGERQEWQRENNYLLQKGRYSHFYSWIRQKREIEFIQERTAFKELSKFFTGPVNRSNRCSHRKRQFY